MKNNFFTAFLNNAGTIVTIVLLFTGAVGQTQVLTSDSSSFYIGNRVKLTLEIPLNRGDEVKWPIFNDTLTKSIEILSKSSIDTIATEGSTDRLLRQTFDITSFDTGFIVIPPIAFEISRVGSNPTISQTDPLLLEVKKMEVIADADIKDIKPVISAPLTFRDFLPYIIIYLVIVAIVLGVVFYLKYRKAKPQKQFEFVFTTPAWEIALQKIETLNSQQLWQKGQVKDYYTALTDILREYFENRYHVHAGEMTSEEILYSMKAHLRENNAYDSLKNLLFLADMAKFAKAQPTPSENEQSITYGKEIVLLTKPAVTNTEKQRQ